MRKVEALAVAAAWLVALGILAQAALAGQGWFVDPALFGLHGGLGHGVFALSLLAAATAWAAAPRWVAVLATTTVLGLIGQTGLGYAGRRGGVVAASALHVPAGVALLGAAVAVALGTTLDLRRRRAAEPSRRVEPTPTPDPGHDRRR